jgi:hypothetical protein
MTSGASTWAAHVTVAIVAALLSACSGRESSPTAPSGSAPQFATHTSSLLTFRYTALDGSTIVQTAAAIEREHARVTADLGVSDLPRVVVTLYPDHASLRAAVTPLVGTIPAFASGLVTGVDAIHIVSPNLTSAWPYVTGVASIVHELAHCVSMRVNPTIANNPRWLWESVALYEAGQYGDRRAARAFSGTPTLALLNDIDNTHVYEVGGSIGQFIVQTWGRDALVALLRTNGNLGAVIGLTDAEFIARWLTGNQQPP